MASLGLRLHLLPVRMEGGREGDGGGRGDGGRGDGGLGQSLPPANVAACPVPAKAAADAQLGRRGRLPVCLSSGQCPADPPPEHAIPTEPLDRRWLHRVARTVAAAGSPAGARPGAFDARATPKLRAGPENQFWARGDAGRGILLAAWASVARAKARREGRSQSYPGGSSNWVT